MASEEQEEILGNILAMDEESQLRLFEIWLKRVRKKRKLLRKIFAILLPKRSKADKWMEKRYLGERLGPQGLNGLQPKKLAEEYIKYAKLDVVLLPHLNRLARRVRHRVYMR
ncbi:MAG: hypothetical protein HY730_02815, partial [Candidatus Tectomicrobia bacterium]|nr:hypothetical protein [Candidatus Tectomicrobia bacterium]